MSVCGMCGSTTILSIILKIETFNLGYFWFVNIVQLHTVCTKSVDPYVIVITIWKVSRLLGNIVMNIKEELNLYVI